ncbi:MAG TPA: PilZ domain-containing protein [Candidatus Sulfotelmatobacter sp.]|jgi:DNA-binding response OmpR family regulator|nr:PilZ domain-containing protein [Candidatus Sulfotelmatobacter sp.]
MTLQALLVSTDDHAAEVLGRVLPPFGVTLDRCSDLEITKARIQQQKFAALIVDFDNPEMAEDVLQQAKKLGTEPLSIALVADPAKVRDILTGGAHFVLYKPLNEEAAKAGLRPAAALLSRERRRAIRVPVQAPVEIVLHNDRRLDGILLDLSETGMEVLTAEPLERGAFLSFQFQLPDHSLQVAARGEVAWATPNGQTGVRFLDLPEASVSALRTWLQAAANTGAPGPDETVPHCKLTDLSLGGCYVETGAPFPERALIDLCLKTEELEVHTEGMVRVAHPGHGMGVEFPSRTEAQRAQVGNLINFLRQSASSTPELTISPRALVADLTQFEPADKPALSADDLEDPLLELLRRGASLQQEDFLSELKQQRNPEDVAAV